MKFLSNLSIDFPLPFQLFADINHQLDNNKQLPSGLFLKPICELNTTNDWINLEALGKPAALRGKELSQLIYQALGGNITELELDILLGEHGLSIDNFYALHFLAEKVQSLKVNLFYSNKIDENYQELFKNTRSITAEWIPSNENKSTSSARSWYDLSTAAEQQLHDCGIHLKNDIFEQIKLKDEQSGLLIAYGWSSLKAGAHEAACRVIEKALGEFELSHQQQEMLFMHLQIIRFLSHQYLKVSESSFPARFITLSEKECNGLYFIKAYAATMSRQIETADKYFAKCHVHEEMELHDEDDLYRLNLFALSQVIKGKEDTAYALEMRIESFIEKNQINILGLKYVNFINIARLYKKSKKYDMSRSYYQKAYRQISQGGYTYSDFIYYHLNFGGIEEAAGNSALALDHYIYAAAYWLAFDNPLALAWRPRLILCQEKLTEILKPLSVDKANQFLVNKINELMQSENLSTTNENQSVQFVDTERALLESSSCHIDQLAIFYATQQHDVVKQPSATSAELSSLVFNYLVTQKSVDISNKTIVMETRFDKQVPANNEQALSLAALMGCSDCYMTKTHFDRNAIEEKAESHLLNWRLAGTVESMSSTEKGIKLAYQRSFLNKFIRSEQEIEGIERLSDRRAHRIDDRNLIFNLLTKRIISTEFESIEA